jgi:hypothetical protein
MATKSKRRPWAEVREAELLQHPDVYAAYEAMKQAVKAGGMPDPDRPLITVHSLEGLPTFAGESEEHEFWGTYSIADEMWDQVPAVPDDELPPPRPRRQSAAGREVSDD